MNVDLKLFVTIISLLMILSLIVIVNQILVSIFPHMVVLYRYVTRGKKLREFQTHL